MKHDQKIKFALIGCGAIANKHMIALSRLDNAEVVGVYDIDSHAYVWGDFYKFYFWSKIKN